MYYSNNNIIVKIEKTNEYAIMNPMTGSFDIMNEREKKWMEDIKNSADINGFEREFTDYIFERGYIYDSKEDEEKVVKKAYQDFNEEIKNTTKQLLLLPTYGCNLACVYCYEKGMDENINVISNEVIDSFFKYANETFKDEKTKPFITLFGGEPLINSKRQRAAVEYIIENAKKYDYEIAAVTNGYDLIDYVDLLNTVKVRELQLTLDGFKEVHDIRRGLKNGKGSFDRIIEGMEKAIEYGFPINLRAVVDKENMPDLVNLASFLDSKGWLDLDFEKFKTQVGRNYELFDCYYKPQNLYEQSEMWAEYVKLMNDNPILEKFHRPDFKGIRHLVDTGEMYMASFDTCPAAKSEWVFDYNGNIYGCTAAVGRNDFKLGTYFPEITKNDVDIEKWQKRDVTNIEKCTTCSYNVICGGGCGVVAANKNGDVLSEDCRPIQEILDIGVNHYADELFSMIEEDDEVKETHTSGCKICGSELLYSEISTKMTCEICKETFESQVICKEGHFVCDKCHVDDILDLVEKLLINSDEKDPVKLAMEVFELENLNMHGPEYHSIVPAVIVAANGNVNGDKKVSDIKKAIKRGSEINGGACGYYGACGASLGCGTAFSVINEVNPLSTKLRGKANQLTAKALMKMAELEAARCCKREAISAIQVSREEMEVFEKYSEGKYVCSQFASNKECIGIKCPYFPTNRKRSVS